jgi:rubrerythrin
VEEDEPYVCCAAAILAWRCRGCAKVSEGFAFPYGACPACGGTLERIEERGRADGSALEPIRMAFEIELGGLAFYERAAREAGDGELEALFGKFAAMEREHMATLSRRYHVDPPPPAAGFRLEIAALYAGVPHRPEDPLNLFRVAIGFELRAERRFLEEAERSSNGSIEHGLYRELAAEEAEHAALLRTEMQRYEQGKAGLL